MGRPKKKQKNPTQYQGKCGNIKHEEWIGTDQVELDRRCPAWIEAEFVKLGSRKGRKYCKDCISLAPEKFGMKAPTSRNKATTVTEVIEHNNEQPPGNNATALTEDVGLQEEQPPDTDTASATPDLPGPTSTISLADLQPGNNATALTEDVGLQEEQPPATVSATPDFPVFPSTNPNLLTPSLTTAHPNPLTGPTSVTSFANLQAMHRPLRAILPTTPFHLPSPQMHSRKELPAPELFSYGHHFEFPSTPDNWSTINNQDHCVYVKLISTVPYKDPAIIKSLTIWKDGSWIFRVHGRNLSLQQFPPQLPSTSIAVDLLKFVNQIDVCDGITASKYICFVKDSGISLQNGYLTNDTLRHNKCRLVFAQGVQVARCDNCNDLLKTIRQTKNRHDTQDRESRTKADSRTPLTALLRDELVQRSQNMAKAIKLNKQRISRLMERQLQQIVEDDAVDVGDSQLAKALETTMKENFTNINEQFPQGSFGRVFWEQQVRALQMGDRRGMRWHPMIIKWCINLRMSSRKAYENIRNSGVLKLPHDSTLRSYIHWTDQCSGFTVDAARQMCDELKINERDEHQKFVVIVHDEMKVQSGLVYKKNTGQLVGFTKLGKTEDDLRRYEDNLQEKGKPEESLAHHVLVFQIRCLFWNFKYPVAHFPTSSTRGYEIFSILWRAIEILELVGLKVVAVTCDGASTNRKSYDMHGPSTVKAPIYKAPNPYCRDRQLFLLNDAPHLIKCVRNSWNSKKRMLWNKKNITWKMVEDLYYHKVDMAGLYLHKKLSYEHIELTSFSKMKVSLAVQVMSSTVANALSLYHGPEATAAADFARTFDKFFDCLNVRNQSEGIMKRKDDLKPYTHVNDARFERKQNMMQWLSTHFINYLDDWKKAVDERPGTYTTAQRDKMQITTETLAGLRRTSLGFVSLAKYLLQQPGVEYVLSEKLNQDKLESLFGNIRQMKGGHEAPSVDDVNIQMNVARMKASQQLHVLRGNTYNKQAVETLTVDDTPLRKKQKKR